MDEVSAEREVELKPYIRKYPYEQDQEGSYLVPRWYYEPLSGMINKIKRLVHIGGYKKVDLHKALLERRDKIRLTK